MLRVKVGEITAPLRTSAVKPAVGRMYAQRGVRALSSAMPSHVSGSQRTSLFPASSACGASGATAAPAPPPVYGVHAITTASAYDISAIRSRISHIQQEFERAKQLADLSSDSMHQPVADQAQLQFIPHPFASDLTHAAILLSVDRAQPPGSTACTSPTHTSTDSTAPAPAASQELVRNKAFILSSGSIVFWNMSREDMRAVRELCRAGEVHPIKDEKVIEDEHEIVQYRHTSTRASTIERGIIFLSTNPAPAQPRSSTSLMQHAGEDFSTSASASDASKPTPQSQEQSQPTGASKEATAAAAAPPPPPSVHPVFLDMFAFSHALANSVELGILETELNAYSKKVSMSVSVSV